MEVGGFSFRRIVRRALSQQKGNERRESVMRDLQEGKTNVTDREITESGRCQHVPGTSRSTVWLGCSV